jgi:syntaxin 1B/2/3
MQSIENGDGSGSGTMRAFYSEITSIQEGIEHFNGNVTRISELHSRSLAAAASQQDAAQLDEVVAETRTLSNTLKQRIQGFGSSPSPGQDPQIWQNQTRLVRSRFMEAIQNYQQVEQQYRTKYKQRVERQFKIVKPDATPEEVAAVVSDDSGGGNQVFAQALSSSTRYGDSRAVYREVQERHQDIRRMEQTLTELAQLFIDMGTLVEQDDAKIATIEQTAQKVVGDTEHALADTGRAVDSARNARRMRWICFIIIVIILAVVAIVLGVVFGKK